MKTIHKINWRHILIHFLAISFISSGLTKFSVFFHMPLFEMMASGDYGSLSQGEFLQMRVNFLMTTAMIAAISKIGSLTLCVVISLKRKWFWLNSVIAFILLLVIENVAGLSVLDILPSNVVESIFADHLIIGLALTIMGLLLLFLKPVSRFIAPKKLKGESETFHFEKELEEVQA